jgi:hypothetical protein
MTPFTPEELADIYVALALITNPSGPLFSDAEMRSATLVFLRNAIKNKALNAPYTVLLQGFLDASLDFI